METSVKWFIFKERNSIEGQLEWQRKCGNVRQMASGNKFRKAAKVEI